MALKLILFFLMSWQSSAKICEIDPKIAKQKKSLNDFNQKSLYEFSISKSIRQESEQILQKLIAAKSPMILNWIKARNFDPSKDAEKIAKEWYLYYSKMFIIATYPNNSLDVNKQIEALFSKLISKNFPDNHQKELNKVFDDQKNIALNTIDKMNFSNEDKEFIKVKIKEIKLYWPTELATSKFAKTPLEFFEWSLAYDPKNNEINVGLNSPHLDLINFKIAILHEIAHSFDSCRWSNSKKSEWPFKNVGECLRNYALKRDDSKLDYLFKEKKLTDDEYNYFKSNTTCNNSKYPPIGIQSDQLPETFADWFAAEAVEKKDIVSSLRSELCTEVVQNPGSSYLKNRDRFFKIYLANKKIQSILNENSNYPNCELK